MRVLIWILFIIIFSCGPDRRIEPDIGECPSLSELTSLLDYNDMQFTNGQGFILSADSGIFSASFNPLNNDEIIALYKGYRTQYLTSIVLYNLQTKTLSLILSADELFSTPKISSLNWLMFNYQGMQLWKIKSNGDSLIQLTNDGINTDFAWSPDGNEFIYKKHLDSDYLTLISDINGNTLNSILTGYRIRIPSWSPNGKYIVCGNLYGYQTAIDIIDVESWSINTIRPEINNPLERVLSINFLSDSENILWATNTELRRTNIYTHITESIFSTCDSKSINQISTSYDNQRILVEQTVYTYYDSKRLLASPKVILLDNHGNILQEILF